MKTKLDKLLENIDPAKTLNQVSARVDEAFNAFKMEFGIVLQWNEFRAIVTKFICHLENTVLKICPPRTPHPDYDWSRCINILTKEYGQNGYKAAFEMVRTNTEGGLYGILKKIAVHMSEEYAGNEISGKINHFWNVLSIDEQLSVAEEYLNKYGHLLPYELTEGNAVRIKANFVKVLEEHPRLVLRMRNVRFPTSNL